MGKNAKRHPKGTKSGGQFASDSNSESTLRLVEPPVKTTIYPACELMRGQKVLVRDVECEVISEAVIGGVSDRFGQKLDVVQLRRLDTGEEGPMHFGPGGIVHLVDDSAPSADVDDTSCAECGADMAVDENEVSRHLDPDGETDFEADAHHVAYSEKAAL